MFIGLVSLCLRFLVSYSFVLFLYSFVAWTGLYMDFQKTIVLAGDPRKQQEEASWDRRASEKVGTTTGTVRNHHVFLRSDANGR